jgi:hypothetical protein
MRSEPVRQRLGIINNTHVKAVFLLSRFCSAGFACFAGVSVVSMSLCAICCNYTCESQPWCYAFVRTFEFQGFLGLYKPLCLLRCIGLVVLS